MRYRAAPDGEVIDMREQPMVTSDPDGAAVVFLVKLLLAVLATGGFLVFLLV